MSLWSNVTAAWRATSEGSRALSAAQDAYKAGEPVEGILKAWSVNTETEVDDKILAELTTAAKVGVGWATRAAVMLVQLSIRLERLVPAWIARFVTGVDWLELNVPPLLAKLRAVADRADRSAEQASGVAQRLSVAATHLADALARLQG